MLRLRARAQGFATRDRRDFLEVTRDAAGLQAQDATAGLLSARSRTSGLTLAEGRRARLDERTVVRTWAMRGTLHFLPAEDLGWVLPLFGPVYIARDRTRLRQLGFDTATLELGVRVIRDLLAERGPTTRAPIREALAERGLPSEGQAVVHLLYVAALQGLICCSDDRGAGTHEFVLLDDWIERGPALPRGAALEEIARRYLRAAGPATVEDFIAWSGLPARDAREGWEAIRRDRIEVETDAGPMWVLGSFEADDGPWDPIVRLLARFDTYLLSYRNRDHFLAAAHARRVLPGGGLLNSTLLVDGRIAGVWQLQRTTRRAAVVIEPFEPLSADVQHAVTEEARDVEGFLGVPVEVRYVEGSGRA